MDNPAGMAGAMYPERRSGTRGCAWSRGAVAFLHRPGCFWIEECVVTRCGRRDHAAVVLMHGQRPSCLGKCAAIRWTPMSFEPEPAAFVLDCDTEVVFIPMIPVEGNDDEDSEESEQT